MKVVSSFVLLLTAVTVFASDSPPAETHQVLYLADAGGVVLRLSVVGEGPKQCHEKFVDAMLKSLDKNGDGVVTVEEARGRIPPPHETQQLQLGAGTEPVAMDAALNRVRFGDVFKVAIIAPPDEPHEQALKRHEAPAHLIAMLYEPL